MGFVFDLYINRECEDCVYGEFDLLEEKYFCTLHDDFRDPKDADACPDIKPLRAEAGPEKGDSDGEA